MESLIVYDSTHGNTEQVAHAIADGLAGSGPVRVVRAAEAPPPPLDPAPRLLVIGGPTQRRRLSPGLRAWLDRLPRRSLAGVPVATFDTRYRMSRFLSGSAARDAARAVSRTGCRLATAPESFFMAMDEPPDGEKRRHALEHLEPGELSRATEWGRRLAALAVPIP